MSENALIIRPLEGEIVESPPQLTVYRTTYQKAQNGLDLWQYFSFTAAGRKFFHHITKSRKPMPTNVGKYAALRKKNYTYRNYRKNLVAFFRWLSKRQNPFPTYANVLAYQAYLQQPRPDGGRLSSTTINLYITIVRVYCSMLADSLTLPIVMSQSIAQMLQAQQLQTLLLEAKADLLRISQIDLVPPDQGGNIAPLYKHGKRHSQDAIISILDNIRATPGIKASRDLAIWAVFAFTGMRVSSMALVTLDSLQQSKDNTWIITLRHKGNKVEPVAIDEVVVQLIFNWVKTYNNHFPSNSPYRIGQSDPIWRILHKGGSLFKGPKAGMSMEEQGIRYIIKLWAKAVGIDTAPHNLRRTVAALAHALGMPIRNLSKQMSHANVSQTDHYIGEIQDFDALNIANLPGFRIKESLTRPIQIHLPE